LNNDFWQTLPDEFEATTYQALYPDLAHLNASDLLTHYRTFGAKEGRTANRLRHRADFSALVPSMATVLEIGPFCNPVVRGSNVSYADLLSQDELVARAKILGLNPSGAPRIDYICPTGELSGIDRTFDIAISSHCLEHQYDLSGHLQEVGKLLVPGGAYFVLVPDKRYCCDHFVPLSNLAEIIVAHLERRKSHSLRSVIEHRALTTHNDSVRHWQGDHGVPFENFPQRLAAASEEFNQVKSIDVHAWYFTPDSAAGILLALQSIGESPFSVAKIYPTHYGANEFWMILRA
jgi:SAM-dependent methyltransferase